MMMVVVVLVVVVVVVMVTIIGYVCIFTKKYVYADICNFVFLTSIKDPNGTMSRETIVWFYSQWSLPHLHAYPPGRGLPSMCKIHCLGVQKISLLSTIYVYPCVSYLSTQKLCFQSHTCGSKYVHFTMQGCYVFDPVEE